MASDLTVIYLSASKLPATFAANARAVLLEAIGDTPLIAVTREPLAFGGVSLLDTEPCSVSNIYRQMLRAARVAQTVYVAIAEDDVLYPREHFLLRPSAAHVIYNQNRLALFTWGPALYHWRNRKSNATLIAPRALLIEALEERFAKWPHGTPDLLTGEVGRPMVERNLGLTERTAVEVFSSVSVIHLNHQFGSEDRQRRRRKSYGPIRAYDVPHWGRAEELRARIVG